MNRNFLTTPKRTFAFLTLALCCVSTIPFTNAQDPAPADGNGASINADKTAKKDSDKKALPPRPLPAQVSEHIMKLATEERKKRMNFMLIVIEDVSRLCKLNEKQQEQLNLAAKGASERSMKKWHTQAETYFKTRIKDLNEDAVKKILSSIGNVNFGGRDMEKESEADALWKDTLKGILSEDQIKKYQQVVENRRQQQVHAYAEVSLAALDNYLRLTPDQNAKMKVIVTESADQYLDEVKRYWGNYFESTMLMSLANAADLDELKKILTKRQYDRHMLSTANYDQFWEQKRKLRKAKAKAARKRKEKKAGAKTDKK